MPCTQCFSRGCARIARACAAAHRHSRSAACLTALASALACGPDSPGPAPAPSSDALSRAPVGQLLAAGQPICSGLVVAPQWVLTSAACGRLAAAAQLAFRPPYDGKTPPIPSPIWVRDVVQYPGGGAGVCALDPVGADAGADHDVAAAAAAAGIDRPARSAGASSSASLGPPGRAQACTHLAEACQIADFRRLTEVTRGCLADQPWALRETAGIDGFRQRQELALVRLEAAVSAASPAPLPLGVGATAPQLSAKLAVVGHQRGGGPAALALQGMLGQSASGEFSVGGLGQVPLLGGVAVGHLAPGAPLAVWGVGGRPWRWSVDPDAGRADDGLVFSLIDPAAADWVREVTCPASAWAATGGLADRAAGQTLSLASSSSAPTATAAAPAAGAGVGLSAGASSGCAADASAAGPAPVGAAALAAWAAARVCIWPRRGKRCSRGRRQRGVPAESGCTFATFFIVMAMLSSQAACGPDLAAPDELARRAALSLAASPAIAVAIVAGSDVPIGELAGVGAIRRQGDSHQLCSGVLVAPNAVLTAAHCLAAEVASGELDLPEQQGLAPRWVFITGPSASPQSMGAVHLGTEVERHPLFCGPICDAGERLPERAAACREVLAACKLSSVDALRATLSPAAAEAGPLLAVRRDCLASLNDDLLRRAGILGPQEMFDVALLFLQTPLAHTPPLPLMPLSGATAASQAASRAASGELAPGQALWAVGFGSDQTQPPPRAPSAEHPAAGRNEVQDDEACGGEGSGVGVKRRAQVLVEALERVEMQVAEGPAAPSFGDSGGPLLSDGSPHLQAGCVLAVASRLADARREAVGGGAVLFTRVDAVRSWLDEALARHPPVWPEAQGSARHGVDDVAAGVTRSPATVPQAGCVAASRPAPACAVAVAMVAAARHLWARQNRDRRGRRGDDALPH